MSKKRSSFKQLPLEGHSARLRDLFQLGTRLRAVGVDVIDTGGVEVELFLESGMK